MTIQTRFQAHEKAFGQLAKNITGHSKSHRLTKDQLIDEAGIVLSKTGIRLERD